MWASLKQDVTVYFLFLTHLTEQRWILLFLCIGLLGWMLDILSLSASLYLLGFLCMFCSSTKIMITNKKPILLNEVIIVCVSATLIFLIYHYHLITQILILAIKFICILSIGHMLWEASIYDVYFVNKWKRDRFDGVQTDREYNPNKIRDILKMHTVEKIRDIILIIGTLLMLTAVSIDTVHLTMDGLMVQQCHDQSVLLSQTNQSNGNDGNLQLCMDSNANKQAFCEWLKNEVQLIEYLPNFVKHGYNDIRIVPDMQEAELKEIGVLKKGHIKLILTCAAQLGTSAKQTNEVRPTEAKFPVHDQL